MKQKTCAKWQPTGVVAGKLASERKRANGVKALSHANDSARANNINGGSSSGSV